MPRCLLALVAVSGLVLAYPAVAQAQDKAPTTPAAPVANPEAIKLLDQARTAIANLHAMSYTAQVEGGGALAGKVPTVKSEVSAARADAGGWKLYTKGTSSGADAGATSFEVSYDGVVAYSNKAKDKAIYEKETIDDSALQVFFSGQGAKHPIAWEVVATEPLFIKDSVATVEGKAIVGGVSCDIVLISPKAPPAVPVLDAQTGLRVWISNTDHLPRKIERLLGAPAGTPQSRILTMTDFKMDEASVGAAYTMSVPDGYAIKNPDPKPEKKAAKPKQQEQAPGALAVGDVAPDWTLKDADGKDHSLKDYKGKIVLLDFWATWCPPCRMAMPGVQKIHEHFKGKPVVVIGMNTSENKDPVKYMKEKNFTYGLLLNAETLNAKYPIDGIPAFFLIGPDGKLLWSEVGYNPESEGEVTALIDKTLKSMEK